MILRSREQLDMSNAGIMEGNTGKLRPPRGKKG